MSTKDTQFTVHPALGGLDISSDASMPYEEAYYWPTGMKFGTACSFDIVVNATSTATNAGSGWVTAQYSS